MRALIEPAELASYLRRPNLDTDPAIIVACQLAAGIVRDEVQQEITFAAGDVHEFIYPNGWAGGPWLLPQVPVVEVVAININATPLDPDGYIWDTRGIVAPVPVNRTWAETAPTRVAIEYDHGYLEVPEGVRAVALAVAGRIYDNPTKESSRGMGAHTEGYTVELTLNEQHVLARYGG